MRPIEEYDFQVECFRTKWGKIHWMRANAQIETKVSRPRWDAVPLIVVDVHHASAHNVLHIDHHVEGQRLARR